MIRILGYRIPEDIAVAGTSIYDISVDAGINQNPGPSDASLLKCSSGKLM